MVGVAGKSKGCSTCRRRKKGCDLARPACGQCIKSGNTCGGYQRDLTFIHHQPSTKERQRPAVPDQSTGQDSLASANVNAWSIALEQQSSAQLPLSIDSAYASSESPSSVEDHVPDDPLALALRRSDLLPSPPTTPVSLTLTALTSLHVSLFQAFYLPRDPSAIPARLEATSHTSGWINLIPSFLNNDPLLQFAYLALTSSRIGHSNDDDNLVASGKTFYGKALREMHRALSDPKRRHSKETLSACSTLSLYEIYEAEPAAHVPPNSRPNGWLSHVSGITSLLEARGPDAYTTDLEHQLFLHARMAVAIRSCSARKPSFLTRSEWMTKPWLNRPKNTIHKLIDIMLFIPVVLETNDNIEGSRSLDTVSIRHQRRALLTSCYTLANHLRNWYIQLCTYMEGQRLWHTFEATGDPSYPFSHYYSFDDAGAGNMLLAYWTCSLMLHGSMWQLQLALDDDLTNDLPPKPLPEYINPFLYAINIAQSLPYFLHPDMGALGPNLALFPMGMAFGYLAFPSRPAFLLSASSMHIERLIDKRRIYGYCENPKHPPRLNQIIPWFMALFTDLRIRNMPGGAFLSTLMRDVGYMTKNPQLRSIAHTME